MLSQEIDELLENVRGGRVRDLLRNVLSLPEELIKSIIACIRTTPPLAVPTLYKIWQSQVWGYLNPNPIDYPSAGTVRKMGTWTAVAGLLILLSVFSDTDVAIVLRAERELNLSGRVAP